MASFAARVLKTIGLYNFLLHYKKSLNKKKEARAAKKVEAQMLIFYGQFLSAGDLVFDVGANVGNRVRVFLQLGCRVVAVEPQGACANQLRDQFGSSITVIQKGLGEKEEEKTMYISEANTLSSFSADWVESMKQNRFNRYEWNQTEQIAMTTMDTLVAQYGVPKFCKIDVEGYELEVLKGLSQPIPHFSLEYAVPEETTRLLNCIEAVNRLNTAYRYNYSVDESMEFALPAPVSYQDFLKLVNEEKFQNSSFGDIYVSLP